MLLILRRPLRPRALALTSLLGLLQIGGLGLGMWALDLGAVGKTSILTYTMPFWLLLMAWVALGERLKRFQWVAVALAFLGLMLVLGPWRLRGGFNDVLALAGAICGPQVLWWLRCSANATRSTCFRSPRGRCFWALSRSFSVALLTWSGPPVWSGSFVAAIVYNVILGNALAWLLWLFVLHRLRAGTAGLATLAVPVIGVMSAWLQLGEPPSVGEALGMAAIVGALILITLHEILARPGAQPR